MWTCQGMNGEKKRFDELVGPGSLTKAGGVSLFFRCPLMFHSSWFVSCLNIYTAWQHTHPPMSPAALIRQVPPPTHLKCQGTLTSIASPLGCKRRLTCLLWKEGRVGVETRECIPPPAPRGWTARPTSGPWNWESCGSTRRKDLRREEQLWNSSSISGWNSLMVSTLNS